MAMAQEPELSEIEQRVAAVDERFRALAEDSRESGERLAALLDQVESGVVRGRREIDRLTRALAEANEENAQLRDLVQSVVALAEQLDEPAETMGLSELETRMERLSAQAAAADGTGDLPDDHPPGESAADAAAATKHRSPRRSTRRIADGSHFQNGASRAGHFVMAEFAPVQDIFRRVSLMTGRLRET